jgi:hypothetical protein
MMIMAIFSAISDTSAQVLGEFRSSESGDWNNDPAQ